MDHFVMWVNKFLVDTHGEARGHEIMMDIDHRYEFFLQRFYESARPGVVQVGICGHRLPVPACRL